MLPQIASAFAADRALSLAPFEEKSVFAVCADPLVMALYDLYIPEGSFDNGVRVYLPSACLTRAEFAAIISRMD